MSYIALARQWRPRVFSELIGQEQTVNALMHSLEQQRLHHAYLFTGTRGVGKTSIARLLAKAFNCETGISATPCLQCDACHAIEQARFIDLIEIDGASRTRVEDTRELLENVPYAPTNARFKTYLIDEVHMLSSHSFNALLKTLEEPPSHVKFILATTEPQKIPATVLSRCLQFHLNPVGIPQITQHLQTILKKENISFESQALEQLAHAAKGSLRDALSLLEKAIAGAEDVLTLTKINRLLGHTKEDYALFLLQALIKVQAQELIQLSRDLAHQGGQFHTVLENILSYLHQIMVIQHLPTAHPLAETNPDLQALAQQLSLQDAQLFYQIGLKGLDDMPLAPTLAIGFEVTLLRMLAFKPTDKSTLAPQKNYSALPKTKVDSLTNSTSMQKPPKQTPPEQSALTKPLLHAENWANVLKELKLKGLALTAAEHASIHEHRDQNITLDVIQGHHSLFTPGVMARLETALSHYYGKTIKISLTSTQSPLITASPAHQKQLQQTKQQDEAVHALQMDPIFQQIKQEFSAELIEDSILPIKNGL